MAQYVFKTTGTVQQLAEYIDSVVLGKSISASLEEVYESRDGKFAMRCYERYSYLGKNRVSLTVSIYDHDSYIECVAMSSGGSQAVFLKINTFGESSFLNSLTSALNAYKPL
ncbi:hypothetical protein AOC36_10115 [Erysipelothrix larvae]|uniref:Uncharacterized protein n=1 Tax=Erysipelothrix larvae TaxID=1514105 RepID=A0A0X8H1F4_9FIRM|nr:DUF6054 family protein [Erysipelothrix larvae]AMC94313.1 hypothetical protein AOC36_10115 [Erysipelothrix larvae]